MLFTAIDKAPSYVSQGNPFGKSPKEPSWSLGLPTCHTLETKRKNNERQSCKKKSGIYYVYWYWKRNPKLFGHGSPLPLSVATQIVAYFNKKCPNIHHEVRKYEEHTK